MNNRIGWRMLARYLAGESRPDEAADIERWAQADPRHAEVLVEARRAWAAVPEETPPDVEHAWSSLAGRLQPAAPARTRARRWSWGLAAAAAVALLVAIPVVRGQLERRHAPASYATGPTESLTVRLPDGSVVRLAPATRLRASADGRREVWLRGTAFFAVAKHNGQPFTVHTPGGDATVLGTRFELSTAARRVRLVVVEGRVALNGAGEAGTGEVVTAGQVSVAEAGRPPSPPRRADVGQLTGWMEGVLIFQATPLSEAAHEIERQYHVTVRMSDPALGERTVSAVFDHQPLPLVATTICRIADATCEVQDNVVWIRP